MHLTCNAFLCKKDCHTSDFSAWSQCTAECDKGATSRDREVVHMPLNGGASCPPLQESKPCNPQPCNKKCELHTREHTLIMSHISDINTFFASNVILLQTRGFIPTHTNTPNTSDVYYSTFLSDKS